MTPASTPDTFEFYGDYGALESPQHGWPSGLAEALESALQDLVEAESPFKGKFVATPRGSLESRYSAQVSWQTRVLKTQDEGCTPLELSELEWAEIPHSLLAGWSCGGDSGELDDVESWPLGEIVTVSQELSDLLTTLIFDRINPNVYGIGGYGKLLLLKSAPASWEPGKSGLECDGSGLLSQFMAENDLGLEGLRYPLAIYQSTQEEESFSKWMTGNVEVNLASV